jgi:hypothetical protein
MEERAQRRSKDMEERGRKKHRTKKNETTKETEEERGFLPDKPSDVLGAEQLYTFQSFHCWQIEIPREDTEIDYFGAVEQQGKERN